MKNEWALKGMTKTGEKVSIEPYITDRDVKVLKRSPKRQHTLKVIALP